MKIEISNGELLDKVTILQIKIKNIQDGEKRNNVMRELETLQPYVRSLMSVYTLDDLFEKLSSVNQTLWQIEDALREKERLKLFDDSFIDLARSVYITNDLRASIKKQINQVSKSELVEEKSYEQY